MLNKINSHYFVTGTDTEIGKTLVAGALILLLREHFERVAGFKPVAAGMYRNTNDQLVNEDIETLMLASGLSIPASELCAYQLQQAIAPHLAAAQMGIELKCDVMLTAYQRLSQQVNAVIVEGAGGFLVPLNTAMNLADLVELLDIPLILVVGMRLGCLNHALLTVAAIEQRGLKLAGWVANSLQPQMPLLTENIQSLEERIAAPLLGVIDCLPPELQKYGNTPYSLSTLEFAKKSLKLP